MNLGPFLRDCFQLALDTVGKHVEVDVEAGPGVKCFNLYTYLEALEYDLETKFAPMTFELDAHQVARFLWCCLADNPSGNEFRGMPILD